MIVAFLQDWELILSRRNHQIHHHTPFDQHYCITTGWMNPILSSIGFWKRIENSIQRITGYAPREDDAFWTVQQSWTTQSRHKIKNNEKEAFPRSPRTTFFLVVPLHHSQCSLVRFVSLNPWEVLPTELLLSPKWETVSHLNSRACLWPARTLHDDPSKRCLWKRKIYQNLFYLSLLTLPFSVSLFQQLHRSHIVSLEFVSLLVKTQFSLLVNF